MTFSNQTNCPNYNDTKLFWSEAEPNTTVHQNCPPETNIFGKAFRYCHYSGRWTNEFGIPMNNVNDSHTFYGECENNMLLKNIEILTTFMKHLSYISLGGSVLGLITLTLSIIILTKYKYLMNYRTKIHKQLFIAFWCETIIQMIVHIELIKDEDIVTNENMNIYLNLRTIIYEYFISTVFLWMLVEGVHIHNIIAINVFHTRYWFNCYLFMGWIIPIPITTIWAILMSNQLSIIEKWKIIHLNDLYWIMASFRLLCIFINIVFLINVIRVLVLKLRANNSSDICQAKTAIKAAILLIPLLGVINFVQMIKVDFSSDVSFVLLTMQALLPAYQGLFVSIIFCLINKDVRLALLRSYNKYRTRNNMNAGSRLKFTNLDSRHRLQSNQNTNASTLLSNTETKTNLDE